LHKAIGLITCASVMAVSLYLFSGGDPSRTLSAQTDSSSEQGYAAAAKRFMQDARRAAEKGDVAEARRLAEAAAALPVEWESSQQAPQDFLSRLDGQFSAADQQPAGNRSNPFAAAEPEEAKSPEKPAANSNELLKKRQAQRLIAEARKALAAGNIPLARSRALQARQLRAQWGLWDERPEHVMAEIDKRSETQTFAAPVAATEDGPQPGGDNSADTDAGKAAALLQQARLAMDAGQLGEAKTLADQAAKLDVTYGVFDDSPSLVLRDIESLSGTASSIPAHNDEIASDDSSDATRANRLLTEAREALLQGKLSVAKEKANEARSLNVTYGMMDDRPEHVLNDVELALSGRGAQRSSDTKSDSIASAEVTPADSTPVTTTENAQTEANEFFARSAVDVTSASDSRTDIRSDRKVAQVKFDPSSEFSVIRPDGESGDEAYRNSARIGKRRIS